MPRKSACSCCQQPMWRGKGSLPEGQGVCLACRRLAPKNPKPLPTEKTCPVCSVVFTANACRTYCSDACFLRNRYRRGGGTPSPARVARRKDYGTAHRKLREELLPQAVGQPCQHCGVTMQASDDLHLDHTEDRTGYRGIVHAACNRLDGARRGGEAFRRKVLDGAS